MDDLKVLFEDSSLLVLDKPTGLVVNDSSTQKKNKTLQSILRDKYIISLSYLPVKKHDKYNRVEEFKNREGIVHRLDADTSGIIIVAKQFEAFINLQKQFKRRQVKKKYITLCYGLRDDIESGSKLTVNAPIGRSLKNRVKFAIVESGKNALSIFKCLQIYRNDELTLFECETKTGRTHQIRVHLAAINMPIVGDKLYSGKVRYKKNSERFNRLFLHASYIKFQHPKTKKSLVVKSMLPKNMVDSLNTLS